LGKGQPDVAGVKSEEGPSFSTGLFSIEFECRGGKVKSRRAFQKKPAGFLPKAGERFTKSRRAFYQKLVSFLQKGQGRFTT
jgi:hypothetical protein